MITKFVQEIRALEDAMLHSGVHPTLLTKFESESGLCLPTDHKDLLLHTNGIEAYGGYLRIFGLYSTSMVDSILWNHEDFWKFAWGNRCSAYWCFGETAWGDQYAYSIESLRAGKDTKVYFMDALSMTPEVLSSSFAEFIQREFLPSAKEPYDVMIKQSRHKLGFLEAADNLVYIPSVLLGGTEEIDKVQKMNARSAMICNGDIAIQLDEGPSSMIVMGVETHEDEQKRMRIRLIWG